MRTFKLLFIILAVVSINISTFAQNPGFNDGIKKNQKKEVRSEKVVSLEDIEQLRKAGVDEKIIEAKYNQMIEAMETEFHYPAPQKSNVKQTQTIENVQITLNLKKPLKNQL